MGPNPEDEALNRILGDMDGMESKRMFGGDQNKGVSITISVVPNGEGGGDGDADDYPEGHDESMCGGGCALHSGGAIDKDLGAAPLPGDKMMSKGGIVDGPGPVKSEGEDEGSPEEDESKLPPFLRKKKKPLQSA